MLPEHFGHIDQKIKVEFEWTKMRKFKVLLRLNDGSRRLGNARSRYTQYTQYTQYTHTHTHTRLKSLYTGKSSDINK